MKLFAFLIPLALLAACDVREAAPPTDDETVIEGCQDDGDAATNDCP
jgi:hypothetical protein